MLSANMKDEFWIGLFECGLQDLHGGVWGHRKCESLQVRVQGVTAVHVNHIALCTLGAPCHLLLSESATELFKVQFYRRKSWSVRSC